MSEKIWFNICLHFGFTIISITTGIINGAPQGWGLYGFFLLVYAIAGLMIKYIN